MDIPKCVTLILYTLIVRSNSLFLPKGFTERKDYWRDPRIHMWGNTGAGGRMHALFAKPATEVIDALAYDGRNIRKDVLECIPSSYKVLDLCCGVGTGTRDVGVDTSNEMLGMAAFLSKGGEKMFVRGNAETYGEENEYDVVTVLFALHEMPKGARRKVLRNAERVASRAVIVMDIHPNYTPSRSMLAGEPYVVDYLSNIEFETSSMERVDIVPKRATLWYKQLQESTIDLTPIAKAEASE